MKSKTYTIAYRRKREGKTNYKKRLNLLKSGELRLVVRQSSNSVQVQLIEYVPAGDKVVASAHSKELQKYDWKHIKNNMPTAYLVGLLAGKKAVKAGIKKAILDIGFYKSAKGSKVYAVLKGIVDGGLEVPVKEEMFPKQERISGKHIEDFYKKAQEDKEKFKNQFSKSDVSNLTKAFEEVKAKIMQV